MLNPKNKNRFIKKHLNEYLINKIYTFDNYDNFEPKNRSKLIEKDKKSIERLINYQVIHAKRSVTSSESGENSKKALSTLTTSYFNKKNRKPIIYR